MFTNLKSPEGEYYCNLCTGTVVSEEEKESEICRYLDEPITDEYASKKFWMLPLEAFRTRLSELDMIINFMNQSLKTKPKIEQELVNVLYSQLVTALEVYLREKFKVGMINPKGFASFVRHHVWDTKYYPSELHDNMQELVAREIEKINFQNFAQIGNAYKAAFDIDIFSFPEKLKREVNRILRYRHCLTHQGEIWENHHLVRIDLSQLQQDISLLKTFVDRIDDEFEKKIGTPYDDLVKQDLFGSLNLMTTDGKTIKQNLSTKKFVRQKKETTSPKKL
jgi:hypothetical protein